MFRIIYVNHFYFCLETNKDLRDRLENMGIELRTAYEEIKNLRRSFEDKLKDSGSRLTHAE